MNHYEQKQEARRERYLDKSERCRTASEAASTASRERSEMIPLGQPILVGHHSEKRHRKDLERINRDMRNAVELDRKADEYERRAASVGHSGISSDDPEAVQKLSEKVEGLRATQEKMKAANRLVRKGDVEGLVKLGFTESQANELMQPDFAGRVGFPSYALSNNNANIKRVEKRIAELKATAARETVEIEGDGYRYEEDIEDNRVKFYFDDKPDEETRKLLKSLGFKWSPKREGQPWVRKLSNGATHNAILIREYLDKQ